MAEPVVVPCRRCGHRLGVQRDDGAIEVTRHRRLVAVVSEGRVVCTHCGSQSDVRPPRRVLRVL
jgi:DNA-directed RNA polymerase subunit RPC12/RpoP